MQHIKDRSNPGSSSWPLVLCLLYESWNLFHKNYFTKFSKNYHSDGPIWSPICTCHDSSAVVTCAKLWSDWVIIFQERVTWIFRRLGLWVHNTFGCLVLDWQWRAVIGALERYPRYQGSLGLHGAHLGPTGPRWAPCWPNEPCYQGNHMDCLILSEDIPGYMLS